jgi:hypothetical protein
VRFVLVAKSECIYSKAYTIDNPIELPRRGMKIAPAKCEYFSGLFQSSDSIEKASSWTAVEWHI